MAYALQLRTRKRRTLGRVDRRTRKLEKAAANLEQALLDCWPHGDEYDAVKHRELKQDAIKGDVADFQRAMALVRHVRRLAAGRRSIARGLLVVAAADVAILGETDR